MTGCSPYDMARLLDEYPFVFEEWLALFDHRGESFAAKRERTRGDRVSRLFARMGRKR